MNEEINFKKKYGSSIRLENPGALLMKSNSSSLGSLWHTVWPTPSLGTFLAEMCHIKGKWHQVAIPNTVRTVWGVLKPEVSFSVWGSGEGWEIKACKCDVFFTHCGYPTADEQRAKGDLWKLLPLVLRHLLIREERVSNLVTSQKALVLKTTKDIFRLHSEISLILVVL